MAVSNLSQHEWGSLPTGQPVELFTLRNARGIEASIITLGGRLVTLKTPDREGKLADIVLGFDSLAEYVAKNPYFGALVGRYANRIEDGQFAIDGHLYSLAKNNGPNSLHGGTEGFDKRIWHSEPQSDSDSMSLVLTYESQDGEEGFPGRLETRATYRLSDDDTLSIHYRATTDKPTVLNLTNHSYFNLGGQGSGTVVDHEVMINADTFTPVNEHLIPTGELRTVVNTPFDFQAPRRVGEQIDSADEQITLAHGYDHNFVIKGEGMRLAARAVHPFSGRSLEVHTTQPGLQFYTGNHLSDNLSGKVGAVYNFRSGFCFETQHFPDSPNQPSFPNVVLRPGLKYHQVTVFKFSTVSPDA